MESCVCELMWEFWQQRNVIKSSQLGFMPGSSSSTQLLRFLDDLTLALDNHLLADVIYLDFSKAFNCVLHERLIRKLIALGIKGKLLNWIRSFLTNRKEIVVVNGVFDKPSDNCSGVPQRSC